MQRIVLFVAICLSGCGLDWSVPDSSIVACTADEECPSGFQCSTPLQRCESLGPLPFVLMWDVQPATLSGTDAFTVAITLNDDPGVPPDLTLNTVPPIGLTLDSVSGLDYTYSGALSGTESPGVYDIDATLGGVFFDVYTPVTIN